MIKSILTLAIVVSTLIASAAHAGDCVLTVTRTACAGQEATSYSKCDGKQTCDKNTTVVSAKECSSAAVKACDNKRFDITKYKKVTAIFDGVAIERGKDFCASKAESYDPDKAFPYRNKAECK